jgi:hypothetical protein
MKRQNNVTTLYLLPLLLVLAVALIPSFQKWRNGTRGDTGARSSAMSSSSNTNSSSSGFLDWNYATNSTAGNSNGHHQDDGTGIGLFIFLIFVLLLFPWR